MIPYVGTSRAFHRSHKMSLLEARKTYKPF